MAAENSFDVACKIDMQEVTNAIDQARRDITTRYDLKGTKNEITPEKMDIMLTSSDDMKLKAVLDILQSKLHRRGIDLKALTINDPETAGGGLLRQKITLQDGVPMEKAKRSCVSSRTPRSESRPRFRRSRCGSPARTATTSRRSSPSSRPRISASRSSSRTTAPRRSAPIRLPAAALAKSEPMVGGQAMYRARTSWTARGTRRTTPRWWRR